jgi:DNA-directed RNA polymerase specialized sigma24 family protein
VSAPPGWPTETEDRRLAADLLAGRASAPGEIAIAFLTLLAADLRRRFRRADPDLCDSAAGDAILSLVSGRSRYDPALLTLRAFLRMAATRDLLNLLAAENRRRGIPLESVAEPADDGNKVAGDADAPSWGEPRLAAEVAALDPPERLALDLMRGGVRDTAAFAEPLGLSHLPPGEQAAAVKRLKDRVKKRLSRAVGGDR